MVRGLKMGQRYWDSSSVAAKLGVFAGQASRERLIAVTQAGYSGAQIDAGGDPPRLRPRKVDERSDRRPWNRGAIRWQLEESEWSELRRRGWIRPGGALTLIR